MDKKKHPNEPGFITRKSELTEDELKELQWKAKKEERLAAERNQLFIILWIGIGLLLSAMADDVSYYHWLAALIASGLYSFIIYKR